MFITAVHHTAACQHVCTCKLQLACASQVPLPIQQCISPQARWKHCAHGACLALANSDWSTQTWNEWNLRGYIVIRKDMVATCRCFSSRLQRHRLRLLTWLQDDKALCCAAAQPGRWGAVHPAAHANVSQHQPPAAPEASRGMAAVSAAGAAAPRLLMSGQQPFLPQVPALFLLTTEQQCYNT